MALLPLIVLAAACSSPNSSTRAIEQAQNVVFAQQEAWNMGDIDGFMQGYWKNDSLCFIGKSGPSYGWLPTLNRYKQSYPNKAAMGQLAFTDLRFEPLGTQSLLCSGQWQLFRQADTLQGRFTLLFKQIEGRWVIVYDHSS